MKRVILTILLASTTVCAGFAQSGVIRETTGEVALKPAGASVFTPASTGAQVAANTTVSTGFRSTAIIAVGSSLITVRPLTRLTLAELQSAGNEETVNVSLQTGRIRVDVKPPAGAKAGFTAQSPSAVASVRGTSFEFDTVNLRVHEGSVTFGGAMGIVIAVNGGEASYVLTDGSAADPVEVFTSALLPKAPYGTPGPETMTVRAHGAGDLVIDVEYK